jgi:hypothetical protein
MESVPETASSQAGTDFLLSRQNRYGVASVTATEKEMEVEGLPSSIYTPFQAGRSL